MIGSTTMILVIALVALAFLASTGITLLVLGCALPEFNSWWMMFVLVFYFLSPIPCLISRRFGESVESSSALIEVCIFLTACIVVSAFGLPIVLAHKGIVRWGGCGLVLVGNGVVFSTILLFFIFFGRDDSFEYSTCNDQSNFKLRKWIGDVLLLIRSKFSKTIVKHLVANS